VTRAQRSAHALIAPALALLLLAALGFALHRRSIAASTEAAMAPHAHEAGAPSP
jgi:hypothetical protein